jgi:hypothetical protein
MGVASLITFRHDGPVLLVGTAALREKLAKLLADSQIHLAEAEDPYAAMAELCRHSPPYAAVVLSLQSIYREELEMIAVVRRRLPATEVWLTDLEGRSAALAEAMRLGATGLVDGDGFHRLQEQILPPVPTASAHVVLQEAEPTRSESSGTVRQRNGPRRAERAESEPVAELPREERRPTRAANAPRRRRRGPSPSSEPSAKSNEAPAASRAPDEPVLTAEELRALLQDQPGLPPLRQD